MLHCIGMLCRALRYLLITKPLSRDSRIMCERERDGISPWKPRCIEKCGTCAKGLCTYLYLSINMCSCVCVCASMSMAMLVPVQNCDCLLMPCTRDNVENNANSTTKYIDEIDDIKICNTSWVLCNIILAHIYLLVLITLPFLAFSVNLNTFGHWTFTAASASYTRKTKAS